ncbi:MAG: hypothetical protein Kow00106_15690 [Anaerolineae bacterium]
MNDEEQLVLRMVARGNITVEEAERLLDALQHPADSITVHAGSPPEMARLRRYWEVPFLGGLILLVLASLGISLADSPWLVILAWVVLVEAVVLMVVGWLSQRSPWLHLRLKPRRGPRIAFSLPLPLTLVSWGLALVDPLVKRLDNGKAAEYLALTRGLLAALHETSLTDPIVVDIEDEDGDTVQIYLG